MTSATIGRRGLESIVLAVIAACAPSATRVDETIAARNYVMSYLGAVEGGARDRGWSMLHPRFTGNYPGGQAAYIHAAEEADWSSFLWSPLTVLVDDNLYCLHIVVPGGAVSVPDFLEDPTSGALTLVGGRSEGPKAEAVVCVFLGGDHGGIGIVGE